MLAWRDNWVTFLDSMLQMTVVRAPGSQLVLPTRIRSVRIDPIKHEQLVQGLEDGTRGTWGTLQTPSQPHFLKGGGKGIGLWGEGRGQFWWGQLLSLLCISQNDRCSLLLKMCLFNVLGR